MFFMTVTFQVIITGLLHPQEIHALPAGFIYYVTIPCMYMLLTIYSLFNMNDVSWGTRENPPEAGGKPEKPSKNRTKFQKILGFLRPTSDDDEEGSLDVSFAGLFRCMFCTHKKPDTTGTQLLHIGATLTELSSRMRNIEHKMNSDVQSHDDSDDDSGHSDDNLEDVPLVTPEKNANHLLPDWLYDPDLHDGDTETISAAEEQFWVDLIEKYLQPIEMTDKYRDNMQNQLKAYRDIAVFAFTMSNALFVLIVFLLQLNKQYLKVKWPFDVQNEIVFDQATFEFTIRQEFTFLEPISMLFVGFFGIVLIVQFIAMLFHRFATVSQILATTKIDW
jgi:chitin synthase